MLFFDELDSIAKARGGNVGDGGRMSCCLIIYLLHIYLTFFIYVFIKTKMCLWKSKTVNL